MSRFDQLRRNPIALFWGKSFIELNILNAVVTLFYLHRDVGIDKIFYLSIVWSIATLIFEVPSGYLADRFGRKRTLILGASLLALSWIITLFAHGFPTFVVIFVIMSASFSCFSGTEEAFLYDSLKESGDEREMTKHNGRLRSAQHLFNIFIPAIGAWIAKDLAESQFVILLVINILATICGLAIFFLLTEPKHSKNVIEYEKGIFRESVETIRREPLLLRAAMNKLLIFIAIFIAWRAYQPFLADHGISVFWLGIFYFLMHVSCFLLSQRISYIEEHFGTNHTLSWSVVVMIASLLAIFVTTSPWLLFLLILIPIIIGTTRESVFAQAMNSRINSRSRATTLSSLNVFKAVLDIPILFLSGWLAKINIEYIFVVAIGLCIATLLFFSIRKRDLLPVVVSEEFTP